MIPSIEEEIRDLHGLFGSPRDPEGRSFVPLADAYRRAGDPSRALEVLESGLQRHPDLAAAHLVTGLVCRDLADDEGAERAFRRVLELDSDNARALIGLGRLLTAAGREDDGERFIERGLALDGSLAASGAPARVPRHSGNPEVVGNEGVDAVEEPATESGDGLEAMEWEVIDMDTLDAPDDDEVIVDVAVLEPEASAPSTEGGGGFVVTEEVIDIADLRPDPLPDETVAIAADPDPSAESFDLSSAEPGDASAHTEAEWAGGDLDIDWGVPEPAAADAPAIEAIADGPVDEVVVEAAPVENVPVDEGVVEEAVVEETFDDDGGGVVDAADLAPDPEPQPEPVPDAPPPAAEAQVDTAPAPAAVAPPDGDLLMDLADLAPDIEPGSRHEADDEEEALPTRTLGELYARQGLRSEAVRVFEALVARSPGDADLRARLDELRRTGGGPVPEPARPRLPTIESPDDDGPPVKDFFADLLGWTPDSESPEAVD
ncbi:tetratricopeptide repeat protein [Gaopeijia maritima]|uniref:tetratricopeptide repeat protein n=1 Tax=Gaopeijia maritima TaxID=3119007 RepID=UPI003246562B